MEKYKFSIEENSIPKYLQIYIKIKEMIQSGELEKNEKLPPIRKLASILNVNNTTIVKSYELLENEGFIYKIVGSGSYVCEIKKYKEDLEFKSNEEIITFDTGNPSLEIFPVEDFKKAINIAVEKEGPSLFNYDEGLGYFNLRVAICDYLKSLDIYSNPQRIQIISGAQQGIDIICKTLINYGDVIFCEEPTYNGALEVFKTKGAKVIQIPILKDGIDLGILKLKLEKIRPKIMYVMPNFQNPTGISYSKEKKQKLLELAKEYDFYILEDDFLSDFKFYSDDNKTLKSYDDCDRVIYIKSFSKILMPGLRIGLMDIPIGLLNKVIWAKYSSDISTSSLVQKSLYYYIRNFNLKIHLKNLEQTYKIRFDKMKGLIEDKFKGRLDFNIPSGGINFFLSLPKGYSSIDFRSYLIDYGVSILPGSYFFDNPIEDRFFRLNIASTSVDKIEKGIEIIDNKLDDFLIKYKNNIDFKNNRLFF
ncbi:MocR-like pyridoxine biosynthesis transcription factor PdxR [Tepidibacter formicigenes]|jgi:DNA-binding transcriptional MocR family regulator|uniref:DNA-binding transcriptional regulator, MocR family, contains an aminotransferase domain n=1 Tax=Tepidibacter formicigenes DSM 15518 TaxID=1123349 RepID=A0A1M6K621_9FIRM|nr:PLP-dependent aminotransferase family protein [Tepidibacter formicigenes]SHJ54391.1 DNA-binding transcriptional regulator, MocR family, contains an aminotransferase domain [Tepidibacter formicigenes DSM 15518]